MLPQLKSSIDQKEYNGKKKEYTGNLRHISLSKSTMHRADPRQDIHKHPADEHEFPFENEDDRLKPVDRAYHGQGDDWHGRFAYGHDHNEVDQLCAYQRVLA